MVDFLKLFLKSFIGLLLIVIGVGFMFGSRPVMRGHIRRVE
jgi:hypothetical protein